MGTLVLYRLRSYKCRKENNKLPPDRHCPMKRSKDLWTNHLRCRLMSCHLPNLKQILTLLMSCHPSPQSKTNSYIDPTIKIKQPYLGISTTNFCKVRAKKYRMTSFPCRHIFRAFLQGTEKMSILKD